MSEEKIDWLKHQKSVCEETPEPLPLKRICSDCIPNPDYIEPNWRMMVDTPYFNEATCEYQICVTVDQDAEGFVISASNPFPSEGIKRTRLLNKYKSPAIILMLDYYGKLIADQIICASFNGPTLAGKTPEELLQSYDSYNTVFEQLAEDPLELIGIYNEKPEGNISQLIEPCKDLTKILAEYELKSIDPQTGLVNFDATIIEIMAMYPEVSNPYALEIYTYIKDFDVMDGMLKVLVAIPSFIFNAVPDAPGKQDIQKDAVDKANKAVKQGKAEVELDISQFFGQITRLSTALTVYSKYQSHFYQTQNGFIGYTTKEDESNTENPKLYWKDYYASEYAKKVFQFWNQLNLLSRENGFSMNSGLKSFKRKEAAKIKIQFTSSDAKTPYKLDTVKAKQKGCDYVEYTKGFGKNIMDLFKDQTLMNYIVRIKEIDIALRAKKSYPWMDFLMKFTYPLLTISYGNLNTEAVEDSITQCVADNALNFSIDLKDYLLDEVLSLSDLFSFEFNSKSCTTFEEDPIFEWSELQEAAKGEYSPQRGAKKDAKKLAEVDFTMNPYNAKTQRVAELEGTIHMKEKRREYLQKETIRLKEKPFDSTENYAAIQARKKKYEEEYPKEITRLTRELMELKNELMISTGAKSVNTSAVLPTGQALPDIPSEAKRNKELYKKEIKALKAEKKRAARENRHPYILKARELAMEEVANSQDSILTSIMGFSDFAKSGYSGMKLQAGNPTKEFATLAGKLSLCSVKSLTMEGIRCLFAGVTEEVALGKIVKTSLQAMEIDVFGFFIKALPPDVQDEVRTKLEKEFKDLPFPWEEGYDPGDIYNTNYYGKWLNEKAEHRSKGKDKYNECEEVYYRLKQALPQRPTDQSDPNYQSLLDAYLAWESDPSPNGAKEMREQIESSFANCIAEAEKVKKGESSTEDYSWQSGVNLPEETEDEPIGDEWLEGEAPIFNPAAFDARFGAGWKEYILLTAEKTEELGDGSYGKVGEQSAIVVRDLWWEYNYHIESWKNMKQANPTLNLGLWGGGKEYRWTGAYESWQSYYKLILTNDDYKNAPWWGKGDVSTVQMTNNLTHLIDAARKESERINEIKRQAYLADQEAIRQRNANRHRDNPAQAALREALKDMDDQDLANVYANMRDGSRIPIGRDPDKKGTPGTFGTALGNAQQLIQDAYIEMLLDTMNADRILGVLDQFPGSQIVGAFLKDMRCSYQGMFEPPIKSFLSTLSLQTCGGYRAGIALPSLVDGKSWSNIIPNFDTSGKLLIRMNSVFRKKFDDAIIQVIMQLLMKIFQSIDEAICKSLNALGKGVGSAFGAETLDDAVRDAFCPDADGDDLKDTKNNLFKSSGIDPNISDKSFDCLYDTLNSTMSVNDYLGLFTANPGQMDEATLRKISELVNTFCPEFRDYLGSPDAVASVFGGMAAYIPPEVRDALRNRIRPPAEDEPVYTAICLTQEDYDQWNRDRENLLTENGIDPETAKDMINKNNQKREDDLDDLAKMMAKNPEGLLGDALSKMLAPPDPTCEVDTGSIIAYEDKQLAEQTAELMKGFFQMLEKEFFQDLISRPGSVLNNILRDMNNSRLMGHELRVNLPFLYPDYANSKDDWKFRKDNGPWYVTSRMSSGDARGFFPETVGIWMKSQLEKADMDYAIRFSTGIELDYVDDKGNIVKPPLPEAAEIIIPFADNGNGEGDAEYEFELKYYVHHTNPPKMTVGIAHTWNKRLSRKEKKKLGIETNLDSGTVLTDIIDIRNNMDVSEYIDFDYMEYRDRYPIQMMVFKSLLESKILDKISPLHAFSGVYEDLNKVVLNFATTSVLNTPDGDDPTGFKFGYDVQQAITFLDLLYVNPDANPDDQDTWEYTHEEEEGVLGKSATENPRVHFLDPAVHGGSYKRPKIYVEPATYSGWLGMIRTFISETSQCEKEDTGFLDVSGISKRAKELENKIPMDERLSMPYDCRFEPPYDKIASPATHGIMEGVVIAGIRIYTTEFVLKTLAIFSGVEFSEKNIDNTFLDMLMDELERGLTEQDVWWNVVSGYTYYLLFLEQAVQVVQRQIKDGLMEETPAIREAFTILNEAQRQYDPTATGARVSGSRIIAFGKAALATELTPKEMERATRKSLGISKFKRELATKIYTLYNTQDTAKVILRALVQKELISVIDKLNLNLRPRPHIENIHKYLLSKNGITFGSDIRSGEMKIEKPVFEGQSGLEYGKIQDVVLDVNTENPLSSLVLHMGADNFSLPPEYTKMGDYIKDQVQSFLGDVVLFDPNNPEASVSDIVDTAIEGLKEYLGNKIKETLTIGRTGIFYLERYLRVTDKNGQSQVYNIKEFQEILRNRTDIDPEDRISDLYGDPYLEGPQIARTVGGSIGIQFGVRLVYSPPEKFEYVIPPGREQERTYEFAPHPLKVQFKDSFYEKMDELDDLLSIIPVLGSRLPKMRELADEIEIDFPATSRAIPVVVYEQNILDKKISELDLEDENFGEELKCYIDKLVEQKEFKVLFDFCFPARTYVSLLGIYSYNAFFASIGQDESEMDKDPGRPKENWKNKIFRRSKKNIRQLFNSTYRTDDDVEEERRKRNRQDFGDFLKNILPAAYLNIDSSVRWWQRFRIVETNPFDADGKDCKNEFQKLFD